MRKIGQSSAWDAALIGLCVLLLFLQCLYTIFGNILRGYSYYSTLVPTAPLEILMLILCIGIYRKDQQGLGGAILFFRAFDDDVANGHYYHRVDPIVGCFGRCFAAVGGVGFALRPLDGLLRRLMGLPNTTGTIKLDDVRWREEIEHIMPQLSLVIVDVSHPTPSVTWELDTALRELGRGRVIVLSDDARPLPATLGGVTHLSLGLPDFEQELVHALSSLLPLPRGLQEVALNEILARGISPKLYFIKACEVLRVWLLKGLMIA